MYFFPCQLILIHRQDRELRHSAAMESLFPSKSSTGVDKANRVSGLECARTTHTSPPKALGSPLISSHEPLEVVPFGPHPAEEAYSSGVNKDGRS